MLKHRDRAEESVAIDLRMLHISGIGTYLRNLVPRLIAACPGVKFYLLGIHREISGHDWAHGNDNAIIDCQTPIYSVAEQVRLPIKIPHDATLFWSPHYNIPLLYRGKLLVTVHDVSHLALPNFTGGLHRLLYAKAMFAALRRKADAILCVSDFTKNELVRLTGQGHQGLYTTHPGVDDSYFRVRKHQNPHPKPYLLFVGNVKPHKNLDRLIEAFTLIKNEVPHDLLIVGESQALKTPDRTSGARAAALGARVQFTGYIEDDLLKQYFAHADALVLPSLYEGFGSPPLEAMACGCPVMVARSGALPETCGDAALYCDPYSTKDIAHRLKQIIEDANLRHGLRTKGLERAKRFTYDRCAKQTASVVEQLLRV